MTPAELAALHPQLFHVAPPSARDLIAEHGLLSPLAQCELLGRDPERVMTTRRTASTPIGGGFVLNDNSPLNLKVLERSLGGEMDVSDWMRELNRRVFLFPDRASAMKFVGVRANRGRERDLYTFDTLALVEPVADLTDITPLNTGAVFPLGASRRGLWSFTPLGEMDYNDWRPRRRNMGLKKGLDVIREVCIRHSAPHAAPTARENFTP